MKDKLKFLVLVNGILTIIGGVAMILYGFEVIELARPVRILIVLCLCINAFVNVANYRNALRREKT